MATQEDLVDLSLFATSPTIDFRFESLQSPPYTQSEYYAPSYAESPSQSQHFQSQRHTGSHLPIDFDLPPPSTAAFDFGFPSPRQTTHDTSTYYQPPCSMTRSLPRSYSLKPLPPLPPRKLCKPRPSRARTDMQSRCILNRLKKTKSADSALSYREPLQQRRQPASTPQLTLTVPRTSTNTGPQMVWLQEEQMWLVTDHRPQDFHQPAPQYTRHQPSPSIYSDTTPPLTPDLRTTAPEQELLSPIQSQFRSLIVDEERRSPLFQEAMQTIEDFDPLTSPEPHQSVDDDGWPIDEDGWPIDEDGWPIYDPRMYESPTEAVLAPATALPSPPHTPSSIAESDELVSPRTPDSSFDEVEREWNSAVSVYSTESRQHSRDASDQSYYSATSTLGKGEDPVDYYLMEMPAPMPRPLWHGIARSISTQTSRS